MRAIRKIFTNLLLATFLSLALYSTAFAHASLVKAEPPLGAVLSKSPDKITFFFSEEIEPKFSAFALYDAQGSKLKELPFTLEDGLQVVMRPEPLAQGTYTLAWRVLSAVDGHVTKGVYPFAIGTSLNVKRSFPATETTVSAPSAFRVVMRWLGFLAVMTLVGGLFFQLFILHSVTLPAFAARFKIALWTSLLIFIATGLIDLVIQAMALSEGSFAQLFTEGILAQLLFQTRYGWVWLARYALVLITALLFVWQKKNEYVASGGVGRFNTTEHLAIEP